MAHNVFSKLLTRSRRNQPESYGVKEGMETEPVDYIKWGQDGRK